MGFNSINGSTFFIGFRDLKLNNTEYHWKAYKVLFSSVYKLGFQGDGHNGIVLGAFRG